jgi:hypothetical protein
LEKLGDAYQHLEHDQPPDMLDQAILNSAHRAVEKKPGWTQFGWIHGLTTTAVFVIAFTVILDQRELAPETKEDALFNTPSRLNMESKAKKQSLDKVGQSTAEMESTLEYRQKSVVGDAPSAGAMAPELPSEPPAELSLRRELNEISAQTGVIGKREDADKDDSVSNMLEEEIMMDEADLRPESPPSTASAMQTAPVSAMKTRGRVDLKIEQELLTIIELKQSGDESWVTELESFIERNPDYPLPDELKH